MAQQVALYKPSPMAIQFLKILKLHRLSAELHRLCQIASVFELLQRCSLAETTVHISIIYTEYRLDSYWMYAIDFYLL